MTDKLATIHREDTILDIRKPDTSGLPEALRADVDAAFVFQSKNIADSTRKTYASAWGRFLVWARTRELSMLPASPETVATYAAHLAANTKKYATIVTAVAAIGAAHDAAGIDPNPARSRVIKMQIGGIARTIGRAQNRKRAITDADMRKIAVLFPADAIGLRDRALLLLWFICASRRSEPVSLEIKDLDFREDGLYVTFRRTKTDQEGKGTVKAVPYSSNASVCPVRAVKAWVECLRNRGFQEGPLFRAIRGRDWIQKDPVSGGAVSKRIKLYAEKIGIDPALVSGHSLRAGFVTSAARKGRSERSIMATTGHVLFDTMLKYVRDANLMKDSAAVGLLDE